jgi:hypothetical protein
MGEGMFAPPLLEWDEQRACPRFGVVFLAAHQVERHKSITSPARFKQKAAKPAPGALKGHPGADLWRRRRCMRVMRLPFLPAPASQAYSHNACR